MNDPDFRIGDMGTDKTIGLFYVATTAIGLFVCWVLGL